jgi:hypothetical protein
LTHCSYVLWISPPKKIINLFGNWVHGLKKKLKDILELCVCPLLWVMWHAAHGFSVQPVRVLGWSQAHMLIHWCIFCYFVSLFRWLIQNVSTLSDPWVIIHFCFYHLENWYLIKLLKVMHQFHAEVVDVFPLFEKSVNFYWISKYIFLCKRCLCMVRIK